MTILGFALTEDVVVMGSDGGMVVSTDASDEARHHLIPQALTETHKIQQVPDHPIFWAICGQGTDYGLFARKIKTAPVDDDWDGLAEWCDEQIKTINERTMTQEKASGRDSREIPQDSLLIVGRVNGVLDAVVVDQSRGWISARQFGSGEMFVGIFAPTAMVARKTMKVFQPTVTLAQPEVMVRFLRSLDIPGLGEPFDAVKVNADGTFKKFGDWA
jgi:hypothetical protein